MKTLWSKILAGEANMPGSFSKKTVNVLSDFDKQSAELFVNLCGLGWTIDGDFFPLVFDVTSDTYHKLELNLLTLGYLESLGLVQFGPVGFSMNSRPKTYYGKVVNLTLPKESENTIQLGHVLLTLPGRQLAEVIGSKPVEGFFEYVYDRWAKESLVPQRGSLP